MLINTVSKTKLCIFVTYDLVIPMGRNEQLYLNPIWCWLQELTGKRMSQADMACMNRQRVEHTTLKLLFFRLSRPKNTVQVHFVVEENYIFKMERIEQDYVTFLASISETVR